MRWRRCIVGLGLTAAVGLGLGGLSAVGFVGYLRTQSGQAWLKVSLEAAVTGGMAKGSFHIGALETDVLGRVRIHQLQIRDATGKPLIHIEEARATYDLFSLATGALEVASLEAIGIDVVLDRGDERLALAELFGPPGVSTKPFSLPIDLDIKDVLIEGVALQVDDKFAFTGGVISGALISEGPVFIGSGLQACVLLLQPGPEPVCAEGPLTWDGGQAVLSGLLVEGPGTAIAVEGVIGIDQVELILSVGSLDLEGIDPLASRVGLDGTFAGTLQITGRAADLSITGDLAGIGDTSGAVLLREGYWKTDETTTWGGNLKAIDFDVAQAYPGAGRPVVLDGDLRLEATGLKYPDDLVLDLKYTGDALVESKWSIEDGNFEGQVANGKLKLSKGAFHGIAGPLDATGTIDLQDGPLKLRLTGSLDEGELAKLGIVGVGGRNDVDLIVHGDLKKRAGKFDVRGRLTFAPLRYPNVFFERLDAYVDGKVDGSAFRFEVDVEGTHGDVLGMEMVALNGTGLDVHSAGGVLSVSGPLEAQTLAYEGLGTFETAKVNLAVSLPTDAPRSVTADVSLGPYDLQTFPGSGGNLRVSMRGDALQYDAYLESWGRALLVSNGSYDLATATLNAPVFRLAPTPRLAWEASQPVALTLVEGGVTHATLHLTGTHGDLDLEGTIGTTGMLDADLSIENLQLDALAELFPDRFGGLSGVLDVQGTVGGQAEAVQFIGQAKVHGLWIEGITRWLDIEGRVEGSSGMLTTELLVGAAGEKLARVDAKVPAVLDLANFGLDGKAQVEAAITLLPGALQRLEYVTVAELGLPEGRIAATVSLAGALEDPEITMRGVLEHPLSGWERSRTEFEITRKGTELVADAVLYEGLQERAVAVASGATRIGDLTRGLLNGEPTPDTSDLELWLNDMVFSVLLDAVPASSLLAAAGSSMPARGEISGSMIATGSPYTPSITGNMNWYRGALAGYGLDGGRVRVQPAEEGLALEVRLDMAGGGHGDVSGILPIKIDLREEISSWAAGPLDLILDAADLPLGVVATFDSGLTEVEGLVNLSGTIKGSFGEPNANLEGSVREGAFVYRALGLRVANLSGDIEGRRRRVTLKNFEAKTEPLYPIGLLDESRRSEVQLAGSANLKGLALSELTAKLTLDQAWVAGLSDLAVRTDGEVLVSGAWPDLKVQGGVDLVNGRISYDPSAFAGAGAQSTDPRLVIHRQGRSQAVAPLEDPVYRSFDLDLDVDLNRNLELVAAYPFLDDLGSLAANLTRATVTARLGGKMNISLKDGEVALGGEVDVVKGDVQLLRTEFTLEEGKLYFVGDEVSATQLELNGVSSVQGTNVALRVRGTVAEPDISTSSPGYDQSQVLVMLLTNRLPESLGTDQGRAAANEAAQVGAAAALLLASSVLSGAASGALAIDADGSIRVGVPWSSSVFAELVLNAFADGQENLVSLGLDWTVMPHVVLELGAGNRFQWTDLTWETRF